VQLKKSAPADRGGRPSGARGAAAPQARRAARAPQQSPRTTVTAAQDKPVEKLSKREARERLRAAEARIDAGEAVVARYQMRAFDDVDAYRAEQEQQLANLRSEFEAEQSEAREVWAKEQNDARERFAAEQAAERLK
jgi:hypothetical protein